MPERELVKFDTWQEVLEHVRAQKPVWYQAPLDRTPMRLSYKVPEHYGVRIQGNAVRIQPPKYAADPFRADDRHLDRFRREGVEP